MPETDKPDSLWSPEHLSDYLRIPVKTLARWRRRGTGPPFTRMGRHVRYQRGEVDTWLDLKKNSTATETKGT
ncbi:hypothetical protein CFP71_13320 [Amycolatopsis thailandensis]|uniref:Helix-turn-helix domain-containing protein n=1 Tax=Amycolatopsis thailandensis TaxID=589330 RepID=A0A229SBU2_9PSEU|nr:helix-turn-helix domain-containing protein [Amycolatopsis thailandensis]OXM56403.1 hypothetical protein CFP71_13320 [Amycolatopsis thailandensis]